MHVCMLSCFSLVRFFVTLWTVTHQAPLSMGSSRQEYWSELPCPPPADLSNPGIKPHLLCLLHQQEGSLPLVPPGKLPSFRMQVVNGFRETKRRKHWLFQKVRTQRPYQNYPNFSLQPFSKSLTLQSIHVLSLTQGPHISEPYSKN